MKKLMTNQRTRMALVIPSVIAAGLLTFGTVTTATADSDWFGKDKHDRGEKQFEKMERLSDKLDMTDEQEAKLKAILKSAKEDRQASKMSRQGMRQEMMTITPDDPEYMAKVEKNAEAAASQMKVRMLKSALVKKDIYAILTEEQKQKMQEMKEKRMKKMEGKKGRGKGKGNCDRDS